MKKKTPSIPKLLAAVAAVCGLALAPAAADCPLANPADCIYVDDDCAAPGSGTQLDPFCSLQDAFDLAVVLGTAWDDIQTILVGPGLYQECVIASGFDPDPAFNEDWPVHFVANAWLEAGSPLPDHADPQPFEDVATLTSWSGAGVCDGVGNLRGATLFIAGEGASVEGFAISGAGDSGVNARGGVTVRGNLIFDNEGELGGGIFLDTYVCSNGDVEAEISGNVVRNNIADDAFVLGFPDGGDGGGIFVFADGSDPLDCFELGAIGGNSEVVVSGNLIQANTARNLDIDGFVNDTAASGGCIRIETGTATSNLFGDPSEAVVRVTGNTVSNNTAIVGGSESLGSGFIFGAGISAGTSFGLGREMIEIEHNVVGPDNVGTPTVPDYGVVYGGGISASALIQGQGLQALVVRQNSVFQNEADFGGGVDLAVDITTLDLDQTVSVRFVDNTIEQNHANLAGGGINVDLRSRNSLDLEDQAEVFPEASFPAEEITFSLDGNLVRNNTTQTGGGAFLRIYADADPVSIGPLAGTQCFVTLQQPTVAVVEMERNLFEGNSASEGLTIGGCSDNVCEGFLCDEDAHADPFCCEVEWDGICAGEAEALSACVASCPTSGGTSDCCGAVAPQPVAGGGLFALSTAKGRAFAGITIESSTFVNNTTGSSGPVGGVEIASFTLPDCDGNSVGEVDLTVDRSVIGDNDAVGIGGPPPGENFATTVTKSSVYDNGGNGGSSQYESTLFPGGVAPAGNILDDPLLDPASFVPGLCSPVYDVGSCEAAPSTICLDDGDCAGADVCLAEGAGHLSSPDLNDDDALDGVDLNRFSATFGAEDGLDARYNDAGDLNGDGEVDGNDLMYIAPLFGQECTPEP